jgi:hypothetical protein
MAKPMSYDQSNKVSTVFDMEQFKGLEKGEKRRICMLDKEPICAVVHWVTDTGYCECLGDYEIVSKGEVDENCPACKHATQGRESAVSMPTRRFVTHIFEYITNNKGTVIPPTNFRVKAWVYGNDKFGVLSDRTSEHGDLRQKDLIITCQGKDYQKYDIDVSTKGCFWMASPELKERAKFLFKAEHRQDIGRLLGKTLNKQELTVAVSKAVRKGGKVNVEDIGDEVFADEATGVTASSESVESLLDIDAGENKLGKTVDTPVGPTGPAHAGASAGAKVEAVKTADPDVPSTDFEELLTNLDK